MAVPSLRSLCVFCGSATGTDTIYAEAARELGRQMAKADVCLIYGGGRIGLMGAMAEAMAEAGGQIVGIIPRYLEEAEVAFGKATELLVVEDMHTRKRLMSERADAFCVMPGGLGTLDETFEILTWKQLGLHKKPIVFANLRDYWSGCLAVIENMIGAGFCRPNVRDLYTVVDSVEAILPVAAQVLADAPETDARSTLATKLG